MIERFPTSHEPLETEIPHNCAIVGVYDPDGYAAVIGQSMLFSQNHRGQEGAGLFVVNPDESTLMRKGEGWVREALNDQVMAYLQEGSPRIAIGQDRYSTAGEPDAWQPYVSDGLALVHNGNLTNYEQLRCLLPEEERVKPPSDSWVAQRLIVNASGNTWEEKIVTAVEQCEGAFNFIAQADDKLFAVRDPHGMRPLVIGKLSNGGSVVASETAAFAPIGAQYIREVNPGEGVIIDKKGINTFFIDSRTDPEKIANCIFELIYIAAPDSIIFGKKVAEIRRNMGRYMAAQDLQKGFVPEVIVPVLNSGKLYAEGYEDGMREELGNSAPKRRDSLIPNPYVGRVFITPNGRGPSSTIKHRVIPYEVAGKKISLIDDSVVRGSASKAILKALVKQPQLFGYEPPREVHLRSMAPMIVSPCYMGVDFSTREELIANQGNGDTEMIRQLIDPKNLTSIDYLSYTDLLRAVVGERVVEELLERNVEPEDLYSCTGHCGACFTGKYPFKIQSVYSKTHSAK